MLSAVKPQMAKKKDDESRDDKQFTEPNGEYVLKKPKSNYLQSSSIWKLS